MSRRPDDTDAFLSRLNEDARAESVADIKKTRETLGGYTLRYFTEAIYGEEYTRSIFGESGGEIKLRDLEVEFTARGDGTYTTGIKKETMEQILQEAHPDKSPNEIHRMATEKPAENNAAMTAIEREVEKLDDSERKIILEFMKNINK